jgi:flagellar biosynthesis protein FlhA
LQLQAETYRFLLYGAEIGRGQCLPDRLLAIQPSGAEQIPGIKVTDPTFGMPAIWINPSQRDDAISKGYTVVEPAVVLATHLDYLVHKHANELLGRQETQDLLEHFKVNYPKLVEDVIPKVVTVANLQRLLQLLLEEGVPIKDLRTILEVASEVAPKTPDPIDMLQPVRMALRRSIVQKTFNDSNEFTVVGIQPEFEGLIEQAIGNNAIAPDGVIEPSLARLFCEEVMRGIDALEADNLPPVIVTTSRCRLTFSRLARRVRPEAIVLAMSELPPGATITYRDTLCKQAGKS